MTHTEQRLREEFEKSVTINIDMQYVLMYGKRATDEISDWWLNKITQALAEERDRVRGEIEYLCNRAEGENRMIPPQLLRNIFTK